MELAIIAAGESSRMKSEGISTPKPLIKLNGESIIERMIRIAVKNGVTKIHCIVNEEEFLLSSYLSSGKFPVPVNLIVKSTPSSMHSLFALSDGLKGASFCLMTADTVFDEDEFAVYIDYCKKHDHLDGVLAVTGFVDDEKPLFVQMNEEMKITGFFDQDLQSSCVTGGIYYFKPTIFKVTSEAGERGIMRLRNFFRLLCEKEYELQGYPFEKIIDVDHVRDIDTARQFILEKVRK